MNNNFWQKLNKPIYALAPMAGISDSAFRQICKEFGADVLYSEMASATALVYKPTKTLELLQWDKKEAPYVVQLFGSNPDYFAQAVKLLTDKKHLSEFPIFQPKADPPLEDRRKIGKLREDNFQIPNGFDINFGCPVPKVFKQGAGAALMQNLKTAREVIKAVIENTELPVSIKLRAKSGEVDCLEFLDYMQDLPISAAMIHGRTLAQGFSGAIDCEIIKKARDYFGGIIIANGGVMSAEDAAAVLEKTKADGIGIARGALGKPWIFEDLKNASVSFGRLRRDKLRDKKQEVKNEKEIFSVALKHAKLAEKLKGKQGIIEMRKHLCWYIHGLAGASALRQELVKVESLKDIEKIFT